MQSKLFGAMAGAFATIKGAVKGKANPAFRSKLFGAMAGAFATIEGAVKGKANPAFRSKYADLASVVDAIKPHLVQHGLWFTQVTHEHADGVCVETIVCHASGEQMSMGKLFVPASKKDAQGFGSALTYARRYSLMTAFGVPAEDDDGNAASRPAPAPSRQEPKSQINEALLATLRSAALEGLDALREAHEACKAEPNFKQTWATHAAALKAAAQRAEEETQA